MAEMLIFGGKVKETEAIEYYAREYAALLTEELWHYFCFTQLKELEGFVKESPVLDMICADVTVDGAILALQRMRECSRYAYITVIADMNLSPAVYMRPQIMAGSLLLRPLTKEQVKSVLREAFESYARRFDSAPVSEQFVIEAKSGRYFVDYRQILYFEAREKKLFLITEGKEIAFYGTMEELENRLPENFLRCHRSFVVNADKIRQIRLGQNLIVLKNGDELPVSRSYRKAVKEYGHE